MKWGTSNQITALESPPKFNWIHRIYEVWMLAKKNDPPFAVYPNGVSMLSVDEYQF